MIGNMIQQSSEEIRELQGKVGAYASNRLEILALLKEGSNPLDVMDDAGEQVFSQSLFNKVVGEYVASNFSLEAVCESNSSGSGSRSRLTQEVVDKLRKQCADNPMTKDDIHTFLCENGVEYASPGSAFQAIKNWIADSGETLENRSIYVFAPIQQDDSEDLDNTVTEEE
ncbi:MAG: hypothetical protein CL489_10680 [Acidobacteria bacterium]|nr:hypothetical protein [Acidobacteriota bacterium]|tara:strand:- start:76 stop:585 length:510 start_codon:yes stop_codon:yes gene_type:complete